MMNVMVQEAALFSPLASEPDLAALVKLFVEEMPDRIDTLRDSVERGDRETLARAAHQLKGAAGSYGFPALTPTASRLEFAARNREPDLHVLELVNDLIELCQRCRAGRPN